MQLAGKIASCSPLERPWAADCSGQPCWRMNDSRHRLSAVKFTGDPVALSGGPLRELHGKPNEQMRKSLGGDEPKLFTPWMTMQDTHAKE